MKLFVLLILFIFTPKSEYCVLNIIEKDFTFIFILKDIKSNEVYAIESLKENEDYICKHLISTNDTISVNLIKYSKREFKVSQKILQFDDLKKIESKNIKANYYTKMIKGKCLIDIKE